MPFLPSHAPSVIVGWKGSITWCIILERFFFFFVEKPQFSSQFTTEVTWLFFFFSMNIRTLGRVDRPLFCSHLSDLMLCDSNFRTLSDLEKKIKLMSKYVWSTFRTDTELDLRCWWFVCFFCFGQNKTQFFSSW